ncbi:MAG: L,D-transpeptidase family protein [Hyphomicrobiaceae bacterium]
MAAALAAISAGSSAAARSDDPLVLVVSLKRQNIHVYRGDEMILTSKVSTGQAGHRTPAGIYSILQKRRHHYSNIYGGAAMPFMQRITWSGIALHAGVVPGYPASHGCIRLPSSVAQQLFSMTAMGGRVIVSDEPLEPRLVTHANLFQPLPPGDAATAADAAPAGTVPIAGPHGQGRRIASAEGPPLVGLVSAPETTGSLATTPASRRPRTQAEARRMREAERAGYENAITAARARRADAESELAHLRSEIEESGKAERRTLAETERLARLKAKAEAMAVEARRILEKEYAAFDPDAELPPDRVAELAAREKELDALLMDRDGEARIAGAEHADAAKALAGVRSSRARFESRFAELRALIVSSSKEVAQAEQALKDYERRMRSREMPISIFVSARTGKVDIRQGFNIIHEAPFELAGGATALGTHVFTAVDTAGKREAPTLRWSVVTAETGGDAAERLARPNRGRKGREASAPVAAPTTDTPTAALERVKLGEETRQLIAELVRPGSSLIISDRGPSNETGKYTDVIVDIR